MPQKELERQQSEDNRAKQAPMKRKNSPVSGNKAHNWSSDESGHLRKRTKHSAADIINENQCCVCRGFLKKM